MSSNEEKAVVETEVSPVSTSNSDPLSSPEEDKCLLSPLSLDFDPLSFKLDESLNQSSNSIPEPSWPATAALINDSVQSKDLMSDNSLQSFDLLTMDDNYEQNVNTNVNVNTNHLNGDNCEINGQLIKESEPTLNCEFESNGWPSETIEQQNNLINLNAVNDCESDVTIDSSSVSYETNGLEKQSTNDCQIATLSESNPFSEESTKLSISLMSVTESESVIASDQTTVESDPMVADQSDPMVADQSDPMVADQSDPWSSLNVDSGAHVIATKLVNECVSDALHENALHLQTDQTLNSSSSLSDSSLDSDHMSSDSVESAQSLSSSGSTRKKKKNSNRKKASKGQSSPAKSQSSAAHELTSQQIATTDAKTNPIEANNKSVDISLVDNSLEPVVDTKPEINGHLTNGRQKKYEMIIRENTPQELPPDVVRSDSKVEEPVYNLAVNLANIRNRFEKGLEDRQNSQSPNLDKSTLQRSESIHQRMQKYQSAVSGEKELSSDEDYSEPKDIETEREKVVFSELSSLKSQWETGSITSNKEEALSAKEELENLRKNLSLGRSESLKQVYERAIKDSHIEGQATNRSDAIVLDSAVKTYSIKEKFENGRLESETEEQRIERLKREREEEIQAIAEAETSAKEARNKFKQIDATATKGHTPQQNGHSNGHTNGTVKKMSNGDVVKSGGPISDDVSIDSAQFQQKFSYFENLPKEAPKEPKRHAITPPREVTQVFENTVEDNHNPEIIKSSDVIEDIPKGDTAKKMLDKFKALENQKDNQQNGPKPLKRITPPRDSTDSNNKKEVTPERDPNIIRSSLKDEDEIPVEPEKAKNLKAKFENWSAEIDRQNSKNNGYDDEEEYIPHIDTTKNLRKKFETAFKEEVRPADKQQKIRVNRFVCETGDNSSSDVCYVCRTKLYPMEKLEFSGIRIHKNCFRCVKCKCNLRLDNFTITAEKLYCIPHFKQLFMEKGNYDEGFGLEQHKDKWNNKCINNNDLIVNNHNRSELICDENANDSHIDYSNQSVSDASDTDY